MKTLEALGKRIRTTEDLRAIVRTMKSLSSVSIHQYEAAVQAIASYHDTIEQGLQIAVRALPPSKSQSIKKAGPVVVLLFGSDYGLCGRFNDQVVDFALERLAKEGLEPRSCLWLILGAKAQARLEARIQTSAVHYFLPGSVDGLTETVANILVKLDTWQQEDAFEKAILFYNQREQRVISAARMTRLLPLDSRYLRALARQPWKSRSLPAFTMDAGRLFSILVQHYLFATIYRAGAESMAAEHATRLSAMQSAERNIAEKLEEMNTDYRHERQSAITAELLDVIAGYEAVREQAHDHSGSI